MVARASAIPERTTTPPPHLILNTTSHGTPTAIPNKHLPVCSPGPIPAQSPDTPPPDSPPTQDGVIEASSITHPPHVHCLPYTQDPPIYTITAKKLEMAIEYMSTQPLPNPDQVFPWLHGLHADNGQQCGFFNPRRKLARKIPMCLRGLSIVKTHGDLSFSKLKGAISPDEILDSDDDTTFIECDPKDGFSVRNFQIQACKLAMISDIVVYGDDGTSVMETIALATRISLAQRQYEDRNSLKRGSFNTFMLSDTFRHVLEHYPKIVAVDNHRELTGNVVDFFFWERYEMSSMSKPTEISPNVFLGPTPDPSLDPESARLKFDVTIEAVDGVHTPDSRVLQRFRTFLDAWDMRSPLSIQFPSSGSFTGMHSQPDVDGLLEFCEFIYALAHPQKNKRVKRRSADESDAIALDDLPVGRKFLIHCTDGYTETSLLGLAYYMYAEGVPAHDAWIQLHKKKGRNFFAYPTDVEFLKQAQPRILKASPRWHNDSLHISQPRWLTRLDGSLPSRILPYMYLGNLGHANNPEMLRELGITRILSVGEDLTWSNDMIQRLNWPSENLLQIDRVQDNGIDPLSNEFDRCLKFIEAGKQDGGATLVHCRVGVSRSATICIAEVMNEMGLSFPRAYCFVRARRLNVIIQPHLRFTYELLKWEEYQCKRRGEPVRRELEWASVAREIALMNRPYSRG